MNKKDRDRYRNRHYVAESADSDENYSNSDEDSDSDEEGFIVESILDKKIENGKTLYLIKWEGYDSDQNTWEPIEHLENVRSMVHKFDLEWNRRRQHEKKESDNAEIEAGSKTGKHKSERNLDEEEPIHKKRKYRTANKKIEKKHKESDEEEEEEEFRPISPVKKQSSPKRTQQEVRNPQADISDDEKESTKEEAKETYQVQNQPVHRENKDSGPKKSAGTENGAPKKPRTAKKKDKTGSFRYKDKPLKILAIKSGKNKTLKFLVEWDRRSDGTKPENTYVTNDEMKHYAPYFLIEFYESKIVVISKKKEQPEGEKEGNNNAPNTENDNGAMHIEGSTPNNTSNAVEAVVGEQTTFNEKTQLADNNVVSIQS